jgi:diguanylate cyclase (GGDEF)-like protein
MLAQYRYPILLATNGREALTLLEQHPDTALVLTDYHMPEMDGLGLVRGIRRRYRREELAIIALSQAHEKELSATMLKAGANDFLNKDFQAEELYCRLVQNTNMVHFVRQLRDLINLDYLTRLYNRRYLFQVANLLHAEASARPGVLALAMVDADYFKRINDSFGHSAGDEALKHIATLLRRTFQHTDIIARYGGEEFVCVVTADRPEDAWHRFDKLREDIATTPLSFEGATIRMTVSIGLTTVLGNSLTEMIACADRAVYRAKAEGRNRVVLEP